MSVQTKDIQKLMPSHKSHLIAGANGLNRDVSNIMVVEAPDVENWMTDHEMLLSSLYGFDHLSDTDILKFMQTVVGHNCSGLIIKTSRFVSKVPEVIVHGCNLHKIPLFEIDQSVHYDEILLPTMQLLFNEKTLLLEQYKKMNQDFIRMAIKKGSFSTVANLLENLVKIPTFIFSIENNEIRILAMSDQLTGAPTHDEFKRRQLLPKMDYTNFQYYQLTWATLQTVIVQIPQNSDNIYLGVATTPNQLQPVDFMAIENAVNFTQMEALKQTALTQGLRTYANDIIDDLLNGKFNSDEEFTAILRRIGLHDTHLYRIVVVQAITQGAPLPEYFRDYPAIADQIVSEFKKEWQETVYRIRQNRIILIIPENTNNNDPRPVKANLEQLLNSIRKLSPRIAFQIGVSEKCLPKQFISFASQALKTLKISSQLTPTSAVFTYNDLGFYRILFQIKDAQTLKSFVPESLLTLKNESNELYNTLKTYLENNQNAKASAAVLFIHPKTMSYRLHKIQSITDIDFSNVDEIFQLNVGVRVLNILENKLM